MTMGQFDRSVKGYENRIKHQTERVDSLNHTLGWYIAFGVNDPQHYPKQPSLTEVPDEDKHVATTDKQRIAAVRIKYGKKR